MANLDIVQKQKTVCQNCRLLMFLSREICPIQRRLSAWLAGAGEKIGRVQMAMG